MTDLTLVVKSNIEAYWKIKDATRQRAVSEKLEKLNYSFSHLGFLQLTLAHEHGWEGEDVAEYVSRITEKLDTYGSEVEQALSLLEDSFPELIRSDNSVKSLKALLDKQRTAVEFPVALLEYKLPHPQREVGSLLDEVDRLGRAFGDLGAQSVEIAKMMRNYADAKKR
jgi:hypothetical protein